MFNVPIDYYEFRTSVYFLEYLKKNNIKSMDSTFETHIRESSLKYYKIPKNFNKTIINSIKTLFNNLNKNKEKLIDFLVSKNLPKTHLEYLFERLDLSNLRIELMPDDMIVRPYVPIVQIHGPIYITPLLETLIINRVFTLVYYSTVAHMIRAITDKPILEFGLRRSPGIEAGTIASELAILESWDGTSNMELFDKYPDKILGTIPHALIMALGEQRAFELVGEFDNEHGLKSILLIDTYDVGKAIDKVIDLAKRGLRIHGVRIDSGDLGKLAKLVRKKLDKNGLTDVKIIVSGDLSPEKIQALERQGAPIDAYAIGTKYSAMRIADVPPTVYKLTEVRIGDKRIPKFKRSKKMYPWAKTIELKDNKAIIKKKKNIEDPFVIGYGDIEEVFFDEELTHYKQKILVTP